MNYKEEIKRMGSRVPQSVRDGDINKAIGWKIVVEKSLAVARKSRASEAELLRAYSDLKAYE
jgi:hypothetical protein